jgi:predicted nucleic acid-binding protein
MPGCFLDTNVLLYSISPAPSEERKQKRAAEILDRDDCCLSAQVLQEFYVQATRQSRGGCLAHEEAVEFVKVWLRFPIQDVTPTLVLAAFDIKARHRLSYWDSAVVAAASAQGCEILYSEDMSHGMKIGGLSIVNPFL